MQRLEKYLVDHGVDRQDAEREALHVRTFTGAAVTTPRSWEKTFGENHDSQEGESSDAGASSDVAVGAQEVAGSLPVDERGYVISMSTKHRLHRLHFLGKCHRVPKVHYQEYEFLGTERPSEEACDDFCRQCWRKS